MIPFFDYRPELERFDSEIEEAVRRVLRSGRVILGPELEAFEREFAVWCGVAQGVGVATGTDALILALRALDVGRGDEVLTVANAGVPPVAAIRAAGATPRFVDVDERTLSIDPRLLEQARTPRTRCVMPVHLYGHPAPMDAILEFAKGNGLHVVEDCAQAHGTRYRERHAGAFGSIGCFSFYPTKNLGAYGDAGMCVTDDPALAQRLRELRMYGYRDDRRAHAEGLNSRMDELHAAMLRVKLRHLERSLLERRRLAGAYVACLRDSALRLPETAVGADHAYHLFVVRSDRREVLMQALHGAGIGFGLHYADAVHQMPAYRALGYERGSLPVSERACETVLSLPLYPGMEPSIVDRVADALQAAL